MIHALGKHAQLVIDTAKRCRPSTHTPDQAEALMRAVLDCLDLVGGATAATKLDGTGTPEKLPVSNRTRTSSTGSVPMNPVHRRSGGGESGAPPSDLDSGFWRHEFERLDAARQHFDRCETVRRAAVFLQRLLERDPDAPEGDLTDEHVNELILDNGAGWPPDDVARKYRRETRDVIILRIDAGKHPLTGKAWTPPELNALAASAARDMRAAAMTTVDIARALQRNASTVREWTTARRRAA